MACPCTANGVPIPGDGALPGELLPTRRLRGALAATTITQEADRWIDSGAFRRALFEVEIRYANRSPHIYLQTSDTLSDDTFVTMIDHTASAAGVFLFKVDVTDAAPLLRYVRWKIGDGSGTNWEINLRIIAAFKGQA